MLPLRSTPGPVRRGVLAVVVAVGLLGSTAACDALTPPPPDGSESQLRALVTDLRTIPEVRSVRGEVRQVDAKDRPNEWLAAVTVRAADTDLDVAATIRDHAAGRVHGTELAIDLRVPRGPGIAPVTVDPMSDELVEVAGRLRREPFVHSASLDPRQTWIEIDPTDRWSAVVTGVRSDVGDHFLVGDRTVRLWSGGQSMEVDATHPGAGLLSTLDDVAVDDLTYTTGTTYAGAVDGVATPPSLVASVPDSAAVAETLATTSDEAADAHVAPRTRFRVRDRGVPAGDRGTTTGALGLPRGSPEPDDATLPTPPVRTPSELPAQVDAVRAFLVAAAGTTGVGVDPTAGVSVGTEPCSRSGDGFQDGSRAVGHTVVPVFTVFDDAQEPFDAVVASWRGAGFRMGGRALGTDSWSRSEVPADGVASATIRGTADGLALGATSACTG